MRGMDREGLFLAVWFLLAGAAAEAAPASVGVETALSKVRPADSVPAGAALSIQAARNEFEPFQIIVNGGDTGVSGVTATASGLSGPGGASIPASEIILYRQGLYQVVVPSNIEGATGPWPDPLIPAVDAYEGEQRNAFPFDVPAGESRGIWVELFVPPGTPAGVYSGTVQVRGAGLADTDVAVSLTVRGFDLPSTASLKSAFGVRWDVCASHLGSYSACGDDGIERFSVLYGRAALDHRISLESVIYYGPDGSDWSRFDGVYSPLFDGTAPTRLPGAKQTTIRLRTGNPTEMTLWHDHFEQKGWLERLFDYTCDEPPATCAWSDIPVRAAAVHAAGIRTLVTTDIDAVDSRGLGDDIDILVPVVNFMHDKGGSNRRADYDAFLAQGSEKELWMYQSCMSHGCGGGCVPTSDSYFTGWPSYMIDVSAVQNRAMEWLSFHFDLTGELYFETAYMLPSAWDDQCDFSGNGDGTLFYPGTPGRIGGSSHIPIESIRLKLIREGMEDYEYLKLLCDLGDCAMARAEAAALFPAPYLAADASPQDLYAARSRIADRIEELLGGGPVRPTLEVARAAGAVTVDGDLSEYGGAEELVVTAGAASATFRLLWDDQALYVSAQVSDPDLWVNGTGTDGELWDADGVEVLLDPLRTRTMQPDADDRHVIVTVANDLLDAVGAGATEDRSATLGVVHAVAVDGTIGDGPGDQGYTVEMSIPWTALTVTPAPDVVLGGDLALNHLTQSDRQTADWAGLGAYAQPNAWNDLRLVDAVQNDGGVDGGEDGGMVTDGGDPGDAGTDAADEPGVADSGCAPGLTDCGGTCVNLDTSPSHCGLCFYACDTGDVCYQGECGPNCGPGTVEQDGVCVPTSDDGCACGTGSGPVAPLFLLSAIVFLLRRRRR